MACHHDSSFCADDESLFLPWRTGIDPRCEASLSRLDLQRVVAGAGHVSVGASSAAATRSC